MKLFYLVLLLLLVAFFEGCESSSSSVEDSYNCVVEDTIIDPRDGQMYGVITIGNKSWFNTHLNYASENSIQYSDQYFRMYSVQNMSKKDEEYGVLNQDILNTICPPGWHIPSLEDWIDAMNVSGGEEAFINDKCIQLHAGYLGYGKIEYHAQTGSQVGFDYVREPIHRWITSTQTNDGYMKIFVIGAKGLPEPNSMVTLGGYYHARCIKD